MGLKLYVVTHKTVSGIPQDRTLIGVGDGEIENIDLRDSSGESISEKNSNFCELTALYWIWKNDNESDVVGLEHYRRFFCRKTLRIARPLSNASIGKKLKKADILLPEKVNLRDSIYNHYKKNHVIADLDLCKKIIEEKFPEYVISFDAVMKQKRAYMYNMFVMRRTLLVEYAKWLFAILFEAEKKIKLTGRDPYQARVFGFLAERLFQVWIVHNHLKVRSTPVHNVGERIFFQNCKNFIKKFL